MSVLKKALASLSLSLVVSTTFAQGLVVFADRPTSLISAGPAGQEAVMSGLPGAFYFGLLIAPPGTTDPGQFTFTGVYATNRGSSNLAGRFDGGEPMVPGWFPGENMSFLIAGWSSSLGHDWEQQWLSGTFGTAGFFGISAIGTGSAGGQLGGVPAPPLPLFGGLELQTGWNLTSVPEPASVALGALGAATLMVHRRCKKGKLGTELPVVPNHPNVSEPAIALGFHAGHHWRGVAGRNLGLNVRRCIPITSCVLMPLVAHANPYILNPSSLIAFGVVAFWALVVEAGIVALLLTFAGLAPLKVFGGFFVANVAVFLFIFCPLQQRIALPLLEAVVVIIDAASIKLLSRFPGFQGESFRSLGWLFAGLTSLAGNAASFWIGVIASGSPWEMHGTRE